MGFWEDFTQRLINEDASSVLAEIHELFDCDHNKGFLIYTIREFLKNKPHYIPYDNKRKEVIDWCYRELPRSKHRGIKP